eukprot:jgi/Chlat1/3284/Chrsp22S03530
MLCILAGQTESVTVIFPMHFDNATDTAIATHFLQEFAEVRRGPSLSTSPACSYSRLPPLELKGKTNAGQCSAGFMSFVLFPRHVASSQQLQQAAWAMTAFPDYIAYHMKCSKAYMHTRMRQRANSLLQVLNRAKPDVAKEKKTAAGKTFSRVM